MKNKKNLLLLLLVVGCIAILGGVTYAMFTYSKVGINNQLVAGEIYMHYTDQNDGITLLNAFPSETYDPDTYLEFTIDGKNTNTEHDIWYEIDLIHGDSIENKTRLNDSDLRFRLVEVIDSEEEELFTDETYDDLTNKRVWVDSVNRNTTDEIVRTYRLYMWIDKDVEICGGDLEEEQEEQESNELDLCIDFFDSMGFRGDSENFCRGTEEFEGMTFQEIIDEYYEDDSEQFEETFGSLIENNVITWNGDGYTVNTSLIESLDNSFCDYKMSEWQDMYASVKVKVYGDFEEKTLTPPAYYAFADVGKVPESQEDLFAADTDIMTITGITNNYTTIEHNTFIKFEGPEKSVCAIINGNLECFKNNNYENEKVHLQSIFDEDDCYDFGSDFHCYDDAWACHVNSDGTVDCGTYSATDACGLFDDGSFGCYVMPHE